MRRSGGVVQVTVRLFAGLRDIVGADISETFESDRVTVASLRERLEQSQPRLAPYLSGVAIAVNEDYVLEDSQELRDGDVVALVPPISGGEEVAFVVTQSELQPADVRRAVWTPASGAVVLFEGVVRNHHEGQAVARLEYEAYDEMARHQLARVGAEVLEAYRAREVQAVAAHHRTGMLEIGDVSLLVAVSASHRQDAFEAALQMVDRIKETVPVWKKEYGPDGARWQEGISPRP
jgi:molybdopterin synthase catalytic subunit